MADSIKILTYNVFLRPPLISRNDKKKERLPFIIDFINKSNYDIICLQEMFGYGFVSHNHGKIKSRLLRETKEKYPYRVASSMLGDGTLVDGGLVILSKYKIKSSREMPFEKHTLRHSDWFSRKGFLAADIIVDGKVILLINTHTQAVYDKKDYKLVQKQSEHINRYIALRKDRKHVVVVGDLNSDIKDYLPKYEKITEVGYTWPTCLVDGCENEKYAQLDYILLVKGLNFEQGKFKKLTNLGTTEDIPLSDHFPVAASIVFTK